MAGTEGWTAQVALLSSQGCWGDRWGSMDPGGLDSRLLRVGGGPSLMANWPVTMTTVITNFQILRICAGLQIGLSVSCLAVESETHERITRYKISRIELVIHSTVL